MTQQPALADSTTTRLLLRVFLPFASGYFLSYLYRTVNAVIAPDLVSSLSLNAGDLGLLTSAYFLTFAVFQLPLGMLLDHFGPRRVEAVLLLFAALGALLFAVSDGRTGLVVGRALIGLGVSACLMASFKAFSIWFPLARLPAVNGWVMAAGGLGALTATIPVETALQLVDWRMLFFLLSLATLVIAIGIFLVVPERPSYQHHGVQHSSWQGLKQALQTRYFWRIAPFTTFSQGAFLAIQGLWAGPWLRDVGGLERSTVAVYLLLIAAAMVAGFLSMGTLAYRLSQMGVKPILVAIAGMVFFMLVQLALTLGSPNAILPLWLGFGFFGTSAIVMYAVLSQGFPSELTGRVNTALNLLVFTAAFAGQWGIGAILDMWPSENGGYHPQGYQVAFAVVLVLQMMAFGWFIFGKK